MAQVHELNLAWAALIFAALFTIPIKCKPNTSQKTPLVLPSDLAGVVGITAARADAGLCTLGAPPIPVSELTISAAQDALWNGSITCSGLIDAYLQRVDAYDQRTQLNAVLAVNLEARHVAEQADVKLRGARDSGNNTALPPLFCVPILLKDNMDVEGMPTTAGSAALLGNGALHDAYVTARLKEAGAIILGKTNLGELAFFPSFCVSSAGGTVRNPYHLAYSPAGSSGGSAAAIAAGYAVAALGTDTGNSVRGPASHAGLVGLRPSLGLVGRSGVLPLRLDRDTVGPLTRSVRDAALILETLAGTDSGDNFTSILLVNASLPENLNYTQYLKSDGLSGMRVGVYSQIAALPGTSQQILELFYDAIDDLAAAGAQIIDDFRVVGNSLGEDWDPLRRGEGPALGHWSVRGRWVDLWGCQSPLREGYDEFMAMPRNLTKITGYPPVPVSLEELFRSREWHPQAGRDLAAAVQANYTSATYNGLQSPTGAPRGGGGGTEGMVCRCGPYWEDPCRTEFKKQFIESMESQGVDVVVYPTWGRAPLKVGLLGDGYFDGNNSPLIAPHVGAPAITVPMGFIDDGLPAGLQFLARPLDETTLLKAAYAYEQATHHRRPPALYKECIDPPLRDRLVSEMPPGSTQAG